MARRSGWRRRWRNSTCKTPCDRKTVPDTVSPMRILAYCLMPNHWHLVLYPRADGDLAKFLQRITLTHTQRYRAQDADGGVRPPLPGPL